MPAQSENKKHDFSLARPSRARHHYTCTLCSNTISQGQFYYRLDPHPMSRYYRGELPTYICLKCARVVGADLSLLESKYAPRSNSRRLPPSQVDTRYEQLAMRLDEPIQVVPAKVHLVNITAQLLDTLHLDPDEIFRITPAVFEELICDRLQEMDFHVQRVGSSTYQKDGGIDIIAYKIDTPFPFFMAVQAKHHKAPTIKTGPDAVRDLYGVIQTHKLNAGAIVTNTTFTPDAQFFARHHHRLLRLKDVTDLRRWLQNQYILDEYDLQEIPYEIEVCPGVVITIPHPHHIRQYQP